MVSSFVVKGSGRTFTVDEKGHEHNLKLSVENWWLNDFESFYQLTPSRFNIQPLEDMEIFKITNAVVDEFLKPIPPLPQYKALLVKIIPLQHRIGCNLP